MMRKVLVGSALVASALGGAAPDYTNEVSDLRAMMEGVRAKTEGPVTVAADGGSVVAAKPMPKKMGSEEMFPGLADELMHKADRIQDDLSNLQQGGAVVKKVAVTETKDTMTSHDRAARFFATHNMLNIGSVLGDQLSAEAAKKAQAEAVANEKSLRGSLGGAVADAVKVAPAMSAGAADDADWDMGPDDGAEEAAEKKRWAAVDALRHRKPPM